jgi:hypothetical protein
MDQVTTQHVKTWNSQTHRWVQDARGVWICVEVAEMTDRMGPALTIIEERAEVTETKAMEYEAPKPSGLKYPGGPVKDPA